MAQFTHDHEELSALPHQAVLVIMGVVITAWRSPA